MILGAVTVCCLLAVCGADDELAAERVELPHGYYWLATPAQMDPQTRYPLIVCLHGTETRAGDMLAFWLSLEAELPLIFIAPQGTNAGWRDADLTLLAELSDQISQTVPYDPDRVLLTGHSAGGAMAFHLLYVEGFPATAVAVTANYLPPTVTAEMIEQRRDVPLFYAVGEADLNRPRMRDGLHLLRGAGARVTVRRPPIGHVLSREIAQAALDWFASVCRKTVERRLDEARAALEAGAEAYPGPVAAALEELLGQRQAHFPNQMALAADLLNQLQEPGHRALAEARGLVQQNRPLEAREVLLEVERRYQPSSVATEAKRRRLAVEAEPGVAQRLAAIDQENARRKAADLWRTVLLALADARVDEAKRHCRSLLALYPDTAPAADARRVLEELEAAGNRP